MRSVIRALPNDAWTQAVTQDGGPHRARRWPRSPTGLTCPPTRVAARVVVRREPCHSDS